MDNFEREWLLVAETSSDRKDGVAPELVARVREVFEAVQRDAVPPAEVRQALERLFLYLTSREGRTDSHCVAVDRFFCVGRGWRWERLPDDYFALARDIGGALHNTFSHPGVAEAFYSTPEQLLRRIRAL